jgi:hypothetical protein
MRVVDRLSERAETHFTEGEPDLEPPEELAIVELDDDAILEEDLDNEDVLEQDVDEDVLEATLEDLVHGDDDEDDGAPVEDSAAALEGTAAATRASTTAPTSTDDAWLEGEDEEGDGDEVEEELDLVLLARLALDHPDDESPGDQDFDDEADMENGHGVRMASGAHRPAVEAVDVHPCGSDEFVCAGCFLVRKRVQLVDPKALLCRDCAS